MPNVTSISPTYVANPGTDSIGIYGTGFTGVTRVLMGDHDALSFTVQSDTEIWATTHHEYTGSSRVAVCVESPDGRSDDPGEPGWITLGDAPPDPTGPAGTPPVVTSISPTYVANPGTDSIGIYGTGFTGATRVLMGENEPAPAFTVQSDTEIWATTHNLLTGSSRVSVYVEGPGGRSDDPGEPGWITLGDAPPDPTGPTGTPPVVTSISPTYVANPGTDSIGIYGTGFTGATRVLMGENEPAPAFTVQSDTEIWATTHNLLTGSSRVSVYVEGPGGRSEAPGEPGWITLGDAPPDPTGPTGTPPVVTSISPTYVANPGTDSIGIYGTGFTGATRVLMGENEPAPAFTVQSDTEIWATTHNLLTGSSRVSVYVEGPGGRSEAPGEPGWITLGDAPN